MIRPPGEAHAGDGKVKGTTAKDIIPDWALYLSIGCGFIGMLLIGIAVAQRYVFLLPRSLSGIFIQCYSHLNISHLHLSPGPS